MCENVHLFPQPHCRHNLDTKGAGRGFHLPHSRCCAFLFYCILIALPVLLNLCLLTKLSFSPKATFKFPEDLGASVEYNSKRFFCNGTVRWDQHHLNLALMSPFSCMLLASMLNLMKAKPAQLFLALGAWDSQTWLESCSVSQIFETKL